MTRRKKQLCVTVMILGGLALVVDRVILPSGPTGPTAAVASAPKQSPAPPTPAQPVAAKESLIPEVPFPRGITSIDPDAEVRDLFAPPTSVSATDNDLKPTETEPPRRNSSAIFMAQHRLQAVMVTGRSRIAVVDDIWVHIGDSIDGCALMGIEGQAARFECYDGDAVLKVTTERMPQTD